MLKHRELSYVIDYLSSEGKKRGQEPCFVTVHEDGQRTIRARSEIFDTSILRDVTYTVRQDFRPVDCYIRIRQNDKLIGTTWFSFSQDATSCEGLTSGEGRISQTIATTQLPPSFITHAVSTDVWHCANIVRNHSLGPQTIQGVPSCSPLPNGASGPILGMWTMRAEYQGIEDVEVPAGNFEAEHVRYLEPDVSLWHDAWCTNDSDRIMLKMYYPVYKSSYVLQQLVRE